MKIANPLSPPPLAKGGLPAMPVGMRDLKPILLAMVHLNNFYNQTPELSTKRHLETSGKYLRANIFFPKR